MCLFLVMTLTAASWVRSHGGDYFHPARVFVGKPQVKVGKDLKFRCSIFSLVTDQKSKTAAHLHFYLCKDGAGTQMKLQESGQNDTIFTMKNVKSEDSGNYSCVYSWGRYSLQTVRGRGENSVLVQVSGGPKQQSFTEGERIIGWATAPVVLLLISLLLLGLWRYRSILKQVEGKRSSESQSRKVDAVYCDIQEFVVAEEQGQNEQSAVYDDLNGYATVECRGLRMEAEQRNSTKDYPAYSVIVLHASDDTRIKKEEDTVLDSILMSPNDKGRFAHVHVSSCWF
ncbi:hypothetical protein AAFF_G00225160 [Aldrovandia affinis]|uniref:Ig-like domain-containing protein n=1 Tax=Aldrovandia affinis TaxID=143900 RepID=A0AAD7X2E2_9TELE|nr:hypothetical protein AAFF_G00225160 [Aldrovandia affinis]